MGQKNLLLFLKTNILIGAILLCFGAAPGFAGTEPLIESTSTSTADGTGNYSRLPFHVTVSVRGGYDDNVNTTAFDTQDSFFTNAAIALSYQAGNARTKLNVNGGAGGTYYFDSPGGHDFDFNTYAGLSLTHKATPRLTLVASAYASYQVEPDFNTFNFGLNRRSGNFFYTLDKFSVAYQWAPRFSTVTSYTFGALRYDSSVIGDFENRTEHTIGEEFRFLLQPTTSLVGEYRLQFVAYETGFRDSITHFLLAGVDHSFNSRLNGSLRAGIEFRTFEEDNSLFNGGDRSSPYFEGTLNYALGKRTSLSWINRYSLEEPDVPGSLSRTTFRTGLQASYAVTPRITTTLGLFYQHDENHGTSNFAVDSPDFTEDAFDIAVGARYAITRNLSVDVGYQHSEVTSDILLREYARNRYFAGLTFSF